MTLKWIELVLGIVFLIIGFLGLFDGKRMAMHGTLDFHRLFFVKSKLPKKPAIDEMLNVFFKSIILLIAGILLLWHAFT